MSKQKIENILCIVVVSLTTLVFVHFAISEIFFHGNFFDGVSWSKGWGRVYVNMFIFVFSLSNSLPYVIRIIKTKNTKSFSPITTSITAFLAIITTMNLIVTLNNSIYNSTTGTLLIRELAVIPSLISQIVSLLCLFVNLGFKIYNIKKGNDTVKIQWFNPKLIISISIIAALIFASVATVVYYKLIINTNWSPNGNPTWLYVLTTISGCIGTMAYLPFITRLFATRHTYSLSLISKVSLICTSMLIILWNSLSYNLLSSLLISSFSYCLTISLNVITVCYKVYNVEKARKLGISEKEFCDRIINK